MRRLTVAAVALVLLAAGCGSGGEQGGGCLDSWNDTASPSLRTLMAVANDATADILVGQYQGEEFQAEALDTSETGTGTDLTVSPGACVAVQSSRGATLFAFVKPVVGEGSGGWHRISATGDNPLVHLPEGAVAEPLRARIVGGGGKSQLEVP